MNRSTRPLVESALLAALGAVLLLIGWYVPVIGLVASMVSPLPVAVAVIRHGARWGVMSSVVTMFAVAPLIGIPSALALWAINGAMGISFGIGVRRNYRPAMVLAVAAAGSVVSIVVDYATLFLMMGITVTEQFGEVLNMLRESFEKSQEILGPNPAIEEFVRGLPTVDFMVVTAPALLILGALFLAYVNFEIFRRILPRIGYNLEPLPPFSRWIFPEYMAHAGIAALLLPFVQAYVDFPGLTPVYQNLSLITNLFFLIEAMSVLVFYLLRSGMSRSLAGLFTFLSVSMLLGGGPLSLLAVLFGMIDILFDFRRIRFAPIGEV